MKVSFLYLDAFSRIGGIQTFNRNFIKACHEIVKDKNVYFHSYSLKDEKQSFPSAGSTGNATAGGSKIKFLWGAFFSSRGSDIIILAHFNLLVPLAVLFRLFSPRSEIILVAHGIEAWQTLPWWRKRCLGLCHRILAVSNFTKERIVSIHKITPERIQIFPNTIEPGFHVKAPAENGSAVFKKHRIGKDCKILFTLCRISSAEKQKGYETVLRLLPAIIKVHPTVRYIIAGKEEDEWEAKRLLGLIHSLGISQHVILAGYLPPGELAEYYAACNVFIMPSTKEGFGIVFLEALAHGKPVIAGNKDGSRDALLNGELGILVDPSDENAVLDAILNVLSNRVEKKYLNSTYLQTQVQKAFGFDVFLQRTQSLLLPARDAPL